MAGINGSSPGFTLRQPALTAGGGTAVVAAILAAVWAVLRDAGALEWLQSSTEGLINTAIIAVVALGLAVWAQRNSTSTHMPRLENGTEVTTTDPATGKATGTTTV